MINPIEHMIQIKTQNVKQDYLPAAWRIAWFREACPEGTVSTEILHLDFNQEVEHEVSIWNDEKKRYEKVIKRAKGAVVIKATVADGKCGSATGMKTENAATFSDNCWIEKCETGAIARALAALGFGTQSIEDEGDRLADAPVTRPSRPDVDLNAPASMQQLDTIKKLQRAQGLSETDLDGITWGDAAEMLKSLQKRRA